MTLRSTRLLFLAVVPLIATTASAQPATAQDPALDNLVHQKGYVTAPLGTLGAVVERGKGRTDVVLVSGFGLGASAFEAFQRRNEDRFHMLAVTLPGFEGTAAPPMPAAGIGYGEQTWTRAAAEAVAALIRDRKLERPLLVVEPTFTEALRADPARSYLRAFFVEPWREVLSGRPRTETLVVDAAGILVMDDQPELVDRKFAEFVEGAGK